MNSVLNQLVRDHLAYPGDKSITDRLSRMGLTDRDFSDDFFTLFGAKERLSMYPMLLFWCGAYARAVLTRRINTEPDDECKRTAEVMLGCIGRIERREKPPRPKGAHPQDVPERTTHGGDLRTLLVHFLEHPNDAATHERVRRFVPTVEDFNDQLFDSFTPEARFQIYPWLLTWCRSDMESILKRRLASETDPRCKAAVRVMLNCIEKDRGRE